MTKPAALGSGGDFRSQFGSAILSGIYSSYGRWLAEEVADLAARVPNLDELPTRAIHSLIKIAGDGQASSGGIAIACNMAQQELEESLEALLEFGFIVETNVGYKPTLWGETAFLALIKKMIVRERFELKGRLEELDTLWSKMDRLV